MTPAMASVERERRMLAGFNTHVKYRGKIYHVQTEDKGAANPVIETLIYLGGEIIEARRTSYRHILERGGFRPEVIHRLMEKQHRTAIDDIRRGRFDKALTAPVDTLVDTKRTLDEIILEYLQTQAQREAIQLVYKPTIVFQEGKEVNLEIGVEYERARRPVPDARVVVRVISTVRPAVTLWKGKTGPDGRVMARFQIPSFPEGVGALILQAFYRDLTAEDKHLLMKPPRSSEKRRHSQSETGEIALEPDDES